MTTEPTLSTTKLSARRNDDHAFYDHTTFTIMISASTGVVGMIGREDMYDYGPKARSRGFRQQIREDVNIVCFINARWSSCQTEFDSQEVGCQNLLFLCFFASSFCAFLIFCFSRKLFREIGMSRCSFDGVEN